MPAKTATPLPSAEAAEAESDLADTSSVARGVFVFKKGVRVDGKAVKDKTRQSRKSASSSKKRKRSRSKKRSAEVDAADQSSDPYAWTWSAASSAFRRLQEQTFKDVLDAVVSHAGSAVSSDESESNASSSGATVRACALLAGVNLPDHHLLFGMLASRMRKEVSPHVACVRTKGHGGGAALSQKALVRSVVAQLMLIDQPDEESDEEDEEEEEDAAPDVKSVDLVLPVLDAWYNNQYGNAEHGSPLKKSPKKKAKKAAASTRPPLVVVFEDFEGFPAAVIQDFILNIVEYSTSLPFLLVFGVATTVSAIHLKLPHNVSSYLAIETFAGQKATELMTKVVEKVVMSDEIPFKLGGKCLQLLLETFLFSDFSVKKFLAAYKYCLFEHYARSPIIPLLCHTPKVRKVNLNSNKNNKDGHLILDHCRSLPSFRRYIEQDIKGRANLLVDDAAFVEFLDSKLDELDAASARFGLLVASLHGLTADLPGSPLGRQLYSVYRLCLVKSVVDTHEYRDAFNFLGHLSPANLERKLRAFTESLKDSPDSAIGEIRAQSAQFCNRLSSLVKEISDGGASTPSTPSSKRASTAGVANTTPNRSGKKLSRAELQKSLLEQTHERRKQLSPFETLRKEVMDFLHSTFSSYIRSPCSSSTAHARVFHEVRFYDAASNVRRHLSVFPRGVVKTALEDPFVYLEDESLEISDSHEIPASFPDLCVAFKLMQEAGRLINLYDWMQSWLAIVNSESDKGEDDEIDPVDQARFTQTVSSLQFMGFVKPSKRKTDHMSKLTWAE